MARISRGKYKGVDQHYRETHREETREWQRKYKEEQRRLVIEHYGGKSPKCSCCRLDIYEFLVPDHIFGGRGSLLAQRRKEGLEPSGGAALHAKLIKENFPPGIRILCCNCNHAIACYGKCPHEEMHELDALLKEAFAYGNS